MSATTSILLEIKTRTTGLDSGVLAVENAGKRMEASARNTSSVLSSMGSAIKGYAAGFVGITAVASFFSTAEQSTRDFSRALGELSALTGAVGKDLDDIRTNALDLSQTMGKSATDIVDAFKTVGAIKGDLLENIPALQAVTKEVITLSKASGTDLVTSANVTGAALNQFGLSSDQASRVVNVLAAGSNIASAEVNHLGESLKYVGPIAGSLGISIEEAVGTLEALSDVGIRGEQAGTGLRSVWLKMATDMDTNLRPQTVGWTKALENLAAKGYTVAEMEGKFGLNAVTVADALGKAAQKTQDYTKKVTGTNAAHDQAAKTMGTYAARIDQLKASYTTFATVLGSSFANTGLIDRFSDRINRMTDSLQKYGLILGGIKALALDGIIQDLNSIQDAITPDTGDAGATQTIKATVPDRMQGLGSSGGNQAGTESFKIATTEVNRQLTESFIPKIKNASAVMEKFVETTQQSVDKLKNKFSEAWGDPAKEASDGLITKLMDGDKDMYKQAAEKVQGSQFFKAVERLQEEMRAAQKLTGERREQVLAQLNERLLELTKSAYTSKGLPGGPQGTAGENGSTFSTFGQDPRFEEQQKEIRQELVDALNNYATQVFDSKGNQETRISITVDPASKNFITWTEKKVKEQMKKELKDAAKAVAN